MNSIEHEEFSVSRGDVYARLVDVYGEYDVTYRNNYDVTVLTDRINELLDDYNIQSLDDFKRNDDIIHDVADQYFEDVVCL